MDDRYTLQERVATAEEFQSLRAAAEMPARSREAAERGLPNTVYGLVVVDSHTGETVGMGRLVGDDGAVYHITDMAVHPDHQRRGIGTAIMAALQGYIEETAPPGAYVNLIADIEGFYERFGFEPVRPASTGMYRRT